MRSAPPAARTPCGPDAEILAEALAVCLISLALLGATLVPRRCALFVRIAVPYSLFGICTSAYPVTRMWCRGSGLAREHAWRSLLCLGLHVAACSVDQCVILNQP